jgi:hypothetical protein
MEGRAPVCLPCCSCWVAQRAMMKSCGMAQHPSVRSSISAPVPTYGYGRHHFATVSPQHERSSTTTFLLYCRRALVPQAGVPHVQQSVLASWLVLARAHMHGLSEQGHVHLPGGFHDKSQMLIVSEHMQLMAATKAITKTPMYPCHGFGPVTPDGELV